MTEIHRREFLSTSLVATAAAVGGALSAQAAEPQPPIAGQQSLPFEIIKHDRGTAQDDGVDIIVRLHGSMTEDAALLGKVSSWMAENKEKYGTVAVLGYRAHELIFRLSPPDKNKGEQPMASCSPCHMVLCNCSCFQTGGAGGNCGNCAHSPSDHY